MSKNIELEKVKRFYDVLFTSQMDNDDVEFPPEVLIESFSSDYYLVEFEGAEFTLDNLKPIDIGQFMLDQSDDFDSEHLNRTLCTVTMPFSFKKAFEQGNDIYFSNSIGDKIDIDEIISFKLISKIF